MESQANNTKIFFRICKKCGSEFVTENRKKRTCYKCVPFDDDSKMYIHTCKICGAKFENNNQFTNYCDKCMKDRPQLKLKEFKCVLCGKKFEMRSHYAKYCPECAKMLNRGTTDDIGKGRKKKKTDTKNAEFIIENTDTINDIAVAAAKVGMSYGEYVAKNYLIGINNNKIR